MGKKLLVADDSVTIQKVIKLALASDGYDILAVTDGKEAIKAIEQEKPDYVLIDVSLPGLDACAVKSAINLKPELAGIRFVLLLSAFEKINEQSISDARFHGRLMKPFDPANLREVLIPSSSNSMVFDLPPIKDELPTVQENFSESHEMDEKQATHTALIENDIRGLTESTIKISGLDNFQWSLDDDKKKFKESTSQSTPITNVSKSKLVDDGNSSFLTHGIKPQQSRAATLHDVNATINREEIEAMIRREMGAALEKMARESVPQIAEALIKKEIEKILSEP